MPFLKHDHKPTIRHPQGHPVAVRAAFNTTGDFIPRSFCVEDDNSEIFRFRVTAIHSIKDQYMIKVFHCSFIDFGYKNDIVLNYDVVQHKWVIG